MKRLLLAFALASAILLGAASPALAGQDPPGGLSPQSGQLRSGTALPEGLSATDWSQILSQINQQAYLKASNTGQYDQFGLSVAVWGDTVVVGAYLEDSDAQGVNGTGTDPNAFYNSGAAYVFVRTGSTWSQQAYLKASNTGQDDYFGSSVAISGDTVVVGAYLEDSDAQGVNEDQSNNDAPDSGAAYVFVRTGSTWSQQAYLKASNTGEGDLFGFSVAVSGDTVVVGARYEDSTATGVNGTGSDPNSGYNSGTAYVFVRKWSTWSQQAYLKASNTDSGDGFGWSVAVSGDTVVVGAPVESSAATGVNGDQGDDSLYGSGAAYVFVRKWSTWSQQAYLKASNTGRGDWFGYSVAVSGDTVVVGALYEDSDATGVNGDQGSDQNSGYNSGAAYVFVRKWSTWSQQAYLKASNTGEYDLFGSSVAISEDTVVVGATGEDSDATGVNGDESNNDAPDSGAAYLFVRNGSTWSQQAYLKASNTGGGDYFGLSVAVWGDTVVVGAPLEDSDATGVNGDQGSDPNSGYNSGAAYLFVRTTFPLDLYARSFTRYEESYHHWEGSNPPFSYRGRWTPVRTWLASEGSYRATRDPGAAVTLSFRTSGLVWIATTGPGFGIARVTLDDLPPVYVDLYSLATLYGQMVWWSGPLPYGLHRVTIELTGTKNPQATGKAINIDAVDVMREHEYHRPFYH